MIASPSPTKIERAGPVLNLDIPDLREVQAQKLRRRLHCTDITALELARLIFGEARQ